MSSPLEREWRGELEKIHTLALTALGTRYHFRRRRAMFEALLHIEAVSQVALTNPRVSQSE